MQCPSNAFRYNTSFCACNPGYIFNGSRRSCQLFLGWEPVEMQSGVDYSIGFPMTIFNFDSIKKFTQSQAVFLEATLLMLRSWLWLCLILRLVGPLGDGRSPWFRFRWWISRLDVCFATRHWLVRFYFQLICAIDRARAKLQLLKHNVRKICCFFGGLLLFWKYMR